MKKITFCTLLCALFTFGSCDMFSVDNYDEPAETLQGEVVDVATGEKVLTDQGSEGIRVRLTELSWGDNVQHNPDLLLCPMAHSSIQNYSKAHTISVLMVHSYP